MVAVLRWVLWMSIGCACSAPALAQDSWASRDYDYANRTMNDFVNRFERNLVDPVARSVRRNGSAAAATTTPARAAAAAPERTAATTVPPRTPKAPQAMAANLPPAQRAQAQQTYEKLLAGYHEVEKQFGIARYDVAGAVAAYLAGAYMGYRNVSFPDQHFKPLVEQMRTALAADPAWAQASVAAKQDMYEQLAIIGMLVANTQIGLARRSDAQAQAAMQAASKNYLEQFLKVDASKVRIDGQGLSVR